MRNMKWFLLLLTLFISLSQSSLIVHKKFKEDKAIKGQNLTVLIKVTNHGPDDATEITLHDQTFNNATAFKLIQGKNYQKVPDLKLNQSYAVSFVVQLRTGGWTRTYPAVVKYKKNGKAWTSYSTYKPLFISAVGPLRAALNEWAAFIAINIVLLTSYYWYLTYKKK